MCNPEIKCVQSSKIPNVWSSSSAQFVLSGVTTCLGSTSGLAATCSVEGVTTDAASMEVRAGVSVAAGGGPGEGEAVLLAIGGEHGMLGASGGDYGCSWFPIDCLLCSAVSRKVAGRPTPKAMSVDPFLGQVPLVDLCWCTLLQRSCERGGGGWPGWELCRRAGGYNSECRYIEGAQVIGRVEGDYLMLLDIIIHGNLPAMGASEVHH